MKPSQFISRADIDAKYDELYEENERLKKLELNCTRCEIIAELVGEVEFYKNQFEAATKTESC